MSFLISTIIIVNLVPMILGLTSGKTLTDSTKEFRMNIDRGIAFIGIAGGAFFSFCLCGAAMSHQLNGFLIVVFGFLDILSILLMLLPVKGFYDNEVKNDTLYARRLFLIRKSMPINHIDHCAIKSNDYGGSIRIYRKGGGVFCWLDLMQNNTENFLKRMEEEDIPVEEDLK